ncbi:hypothetical protein DID76_03125 [Candidatus Marinamargulisbacteria bacterium SCGC AG-414-C22]|nr:hypothetical protein DID76_03125 [Candidatus Marinamargulisbacteria bacterium SCGC AG-414-C22]
MRYRSYNNGGNFFGIGILMFIMFGGVKLLFALLPLLALLFPLFILFFVFRVGRTAFSNSKINDYVKTTNVHKQHYVELMIRLICHVVKADNKIDQREIQSIILFFQQRMRYSVRQIMWIQDLLQHSLRSTAPLESICNELNQAYSDDEKHLLLELLFEVAAADGTIASSEMAVIRKAVTLLHIPDHIFNSIKSAYTSQATVNADDDLYAALGLTPEATRDDIKKAYKESCKKYHPDKVQHLGDDFKTFAEEKIKKINKAYDVLYKQA